MYIYIYIYLYIYYNHIPPHLFDARSLRAKSCANPPGALRRILRRSPGGIRGRVLMKTPWGYFLGNLLGKTTPAGIVGHPSGNPWVLQGIVASESVQNCITKRVRLLPRGMNFHSRLPSPSGSFLPQKRQGQGHRGSMFVLLYCLKCCFVCCFSFSGPGSLWSELRPQGQLGNPEPGPDMI